MAQLSERTDAAGTADVMLKNECKKLQRSIPSHVLSLMNETQIRSYLKMVVTKLAEITDVLYDPTRKVNPDAEMIIDVLKTVLRHYFDVLTDEVILPKLFCLTEAIDFNLKWQSIKDKLEEARVDPFLIDVIYFPFSRLVSPEIEVTWYDYKYLKVYTSVLESEMTGLAGDEEGLFNLILGLGYNHVRFTSYYTNRLRAELKEQDDLGKRSLLQEAHTNIGQVISRTIMSFNPSKAGVVEDLSNWIAIELKRGERLLLTTDDVVSDNSLNTVLSTSELSCWQKLQYDAGIYLETNVDVFTQKISSNFKTKRGMRPSGTSVKSKLYGKEPDIYKLLQPFVNKMKEDIDRFLR